MLLWPSIAFICLCALFGALGGYGVGAGNPSHRPEWKRWLIYFGYAAIGLVLAAAIGELRQAYPIEDAYFYAGLVAMVFTWAVSILVLRGKRAT